MIYEPWGVPPGPYCHPCAAACGLTPDVYTSGLLSTPSTYQLDKIRKHTMATTDNDAFKTVFNDGMWDACAHYVVNTTVPGVVEITERGSVTSCGWQEWMSDTGSPATVSSWLRCRESYWRFPRTRTRCITSNVTQRIW